jgi:hypothetical protein
MVVGFAAQLVVTLAPRAEFLASWRRRETGAGSPLPGDRPITVPSAVASSPGWRVALHGGGIEEVTLNDLRIRIRQREVVDTTEVSPPGTDQWVRAVDRPELDLQRDPHPGPLLEPLPQVLQRRLDLAPFDDHPTFIQYTEMARPIPQVHSDGPRRTDRRQGGHHSARLRSPRPITPRHRPLDPARHGATLPHGRSPFWASSPQCPCSGFSDCAGETGLLIPSRLRSPLNSVSLGLPRSAMNVS